MTVKMTRGEHYPAPHSADVHPDEVEHYRAGGFELADPLDHDHSGKKGGSEKGAASTAHKGASKRKKA